MAGNTKRTAYPIVGKGPKRFREGFFRGKSEVQGGFHEVTPLDRHPIPAPHFRSFPREQQTRSRDWTHCPKSVYGWNNWVKSGLTLPIMTEQGFWVRV